MTLKPRLTAVMLTPLSEKVGHKVPQPIQFQSSDFDLIIAHPHSQPTCLLQAASQVHLTLQLFRVMYGIDGIWFAAGRFV